MENTNNITTAWASFLLTASALCMFSSLKQQFSFLKNKVEVNSQSLAQKFEIKNGITFYYFSRSPCARRVWLTLISKNIKCNMVLVDLMKGEQRDPAYLRINPQGKVPAIVVKNHNTLPDCHLFESQAIVEWLDEAFPDSDQLLKVDRMLLETSESNLQTLNSRITVKMWQYWELVLAEEIWPLSRHQVDGVIWRMTYTRSEFFKSGPPSQQSDDPFYKEKVTQIYEGRYLKNSQVKRSILRIIGAFKMLENALKTLSSENSFYLVDNVFSQADIAVYPRLTKMPQNGIISTHEERNNFPYLIKYFDYLKNNINAFKQFQKDDNRIWQSGTFPKFVPFWWGYVLPWWLVVYIGNYKAGVKFERITQYSIGQGAIDEAKNIVDEFHLSVIPNDIFISPSSTTSSISFENESKSLISKHIKSNENVDFNIPILFCDDSLPMSAAVSICADLIGFKCIKVQINSLNLENFQAEYLKIMPFGELPALVVNNRSIYGPHIIIEAMQSFIHIDRELYGKKENFQDFTHENNQSDPAPAVIMLKALHELSAVQRAITRRWFGWMRTAWYYQIQFLCTHNKFIKVKKQFSTLEEFLVHLKPFTSKSSKLAADELIEEYTNEKSDEDLHHYKYELAQRLLYVESELRNISGESVKISFLCGSEPTYCDIFVLLTVVLAEIVCNVSLNTTDHAHIISWRNYLLAEPVIKNMCDVITGFYV